MYKRQVAYVHNLCSEESNIITSLECTSETIELEKHEEKMCIRDRARSTSQ